MLVFNFPMEFVEEIQYQIKNYLKIDIYYDNMIYELVEEKPVYDPFNMIGKFLSHAFSANVIIHNSTTNSFRS